MANVIVAAILLVMTGAAVHYIIKEKKRGVRCIGCPSAGICAKRCQEGSACQCGSHTNKQSGT